MLNNYRQKESLTKIYVEAFSFSCGPISVSEESVVPDSVTSSHSPKVWASYRCLTAAIITIIIIIKLYSNK